jgi:hypothetical protein
MRKKLLVRSPLQALLDYTTNFKQVLVTLMICAFYSAAFATNDPPTCENYGPENADNIVYKVNGSVVASLSGNVSSGDHVEVCFNLSGDGDATMFTLVSYSAPSATFDGSTASLQTIFDVDTKTFSGEGTCCLSVDVPNCFFQIDLVKGCAITQLGPNGSNNFYSAQGRLIVGLNGGTGTCSCVASADASADVTLDCGELQTTITGSTYTHSPTVSWQALAGGNIVAGGNTLTPTVNATGLYVLSVQDTLNCTETDTVHVTVYTDVDVNLGNDTVVTSCEGTLTLDAGISGMAYLWSTGATTQTITVSATGTYYVAVTNEGNCTYLDTIHVTINPASVELGNDTILCAGASIMLDAGHSGLSFMWNTGATSQMITVTTSGTYVVSVTDGECVMTDTIHVTVLPPFTVDLGADITITACSAPVTLDAGNNGMLYLWSTGATTQTISVSATGTYYVAVSNGGICTLMDTINVTINPLSLTVDLGNDTILCAGQSIVLDAGNTGLDFMWNTSATTQMITVSTSGTFEVMVMDGNCMAMDTIEVTVLPELNLDLGADTTVVFCIGSLTLDAGTSGMMYLWSTGATTQTIEVTTSGTYSVMLTNLGGCMVMDTINVTVNPGTITVNLGMDTTITTCSHETITLDAGITSGLYTWNTGSTSQTLTVTTTGTYYVDVMDTLGCMASDTVMVTIIDNTIDLDLGADTTVCECILLTAPSGGTMYTWCNGSDYQQINACTSGMYCVTVSNGTCMASDTVMITINTPPTVDLGADTVVLSGAVVLDAGAAASFMWNTGATTQTILVTVSGTYYVTITDVFGCSATDTIMVTVPVGINEAAADAISVYPNPAENYITIDLGSFAVTSVDIKISNTLGQVIYAETANQLKNKVKTIDLSGNEKGIYFITIQSDNKLSSKKIVLK